MEFQLFIADIKKVVLESLSHLDLEIIYLFGSAASDSMGRESDVDIAFLSYSTYDAMDIFYLAQDIAGKIGREVDLVQLKESSTVFQKEVVLGGKLLWQKSQLETDAFEGLVLKKYNDLNRKRTGILQDIENEVKNG